ncbi:MAG: hypothetical protein FJZ78_02965 [Bacteroidetes bacterium]|nr:hypothetical protein [Bacteroidota bacterium]
MIKNLIQLVQFLFLVPVFLGISHVKAQVSDTLKFKVGDKSSLLLLLDSKEDLDSLRFFNFRGLVNDAERHIQKKDSLSATSSRTKYLRSLEEVDSLLADAIRLAEERLQSMAKDNPEYELELELQKDRIRKLARSYDQQLREDMDQERFSEDRERFSEDQGNRRDYNFNFNFDWPEKFLQRRDQDDWDGEERKREKADRRRTYNSFNIDFGTNNFLREGEFVDQAAVPYTVRPLGSWYVAANSIYRTRLANKLFIEWGYGLGFYNFKFLDNNIRIIKTPDEVRFVEDGRDADFIKSKLTAYYAQASFVPVLDFGGNRHKPGIFDDHRSRSFRIGIGPYAGYRIDSFSKLVFEEDGRKKTDRNHDNFFLENIRYGARLQFGVRNTDFFVNYDMSQLFTKGKGPDVNAFSFGVSF